MDPVAPLPLQPARLVLSALLAAGAVEALTCAVRFGAGLQGTRDTAFLAPWTLGLRIHHGYVGALLLAAGFLARLPRRWRRAAFLLGAALLLSDLAHHFLVLWPLTGSPGLDLAYPGR